MVLRGRVVHGQCPDFVFWESLFGNFPYSTIKCLPFVTQAGNAQVKSEAQQPVHAKPLSPDARASSLPETSPPKSVKVWWPSIPEPAKTDLLGSPIHLQSLRLLPSVVAPDNAPLSARHCAQKHPVLCSGGWSQMFLSSWKSGKFWKLCKENLKLKSCDFNVQVHTFVKRWSP